jgi:hypothetical protein
MASVTGRKIVGLQSEYDSEVMRFREELQSAEAAEKNPAAALEPARPPESIQLKLLTGVPA